MWRAVFLYCTLALRLTSFAQNAPVVWGTRPNTAADEYRIGMSWFKRGIWTSATPHLYSAVLKAQPGDSALFDSFAVNCIVSAYNEVVGFDHGFKAYIALRRKLKSSISRELTLMAVMNLRQNGCSAHAADSTLIFECLDELVADSDVWLYLKGHIYNCMGGANVKWDPPGQGFHYTSLGAYFVNAYYAKYAADAWKKLLPVVVNRTGKYYD